MNAEAIESVLHEVLTQQKETLTLNKQLAHKMEYLSGKLENFSGEINRHQNISSGADSKGLENHIREHEIKTNCGCSLGKCYPRKANNNFSQNLGHPNVTGCSLIASHILQ